MKNRQAILKGTKIALSLFIALLIIILCVWFYPPILALGYAIVGRSPSCTILQAFRGAQASLKYHKIEEEYVNSKSQFKLAQSDSEGFHRWQTPDGFYWIPGGSDQVLPVLVAQQKANIYGLDRYGVKKGDIVFDCGAHIGIFARKALALGASRVIAIEPGPENLECLRRNLKQEIADGLVTVISKGVWDKETVLKFHTFPGNSAADSFVTEGGDAPVVDYEVDVTTIDHLINHLGLDGVDLIKMDIKGSTERALRGAKKTLTDLKPRLAISTEERADNISRIIELCKELQPAYTMDCGYCAIENGSLLPMVVFLHP
jgi:FkbM family methyltransferase